ncbi:RidA family protein [Mucisphaera calidilacus]|uniref:Endoribonuclease L-PSP n=1 Tax=Mucisphaera calidilacus TaxID=2527982 RepID=A0A518BXB9_9BACT|nr:RidA family protein [Mucisphaera calidilacus]QDU71630.1 Endoribonuclease L-PSP [Mucisphaera calidilacus]
MSDLNHPRRALAALGYELPKPAAAVASYLPATRQNDLIVISGQLPLVDGELMVSGPVPSAVSVEKAAKAAGRCVVNALAAADALLEADWSCVERIVRVGVFVWGDEGFAEQHLVANGASDLLVRAFGDQGRHARAAVGVSGLPLGASVEVELWLGLAGSA